MKSENRLLIICFLLIIVEIQFLYMLFGVKNKNITQSLGPVMKVLSLKDEYGIPYIAIPAEGGLYHVYKF